MTYKEAKEKCHVRSAIYQTSNPDKKYWKNHPMALDDRVNNYLKLAIDWEEYDPRDEDACSLFMYND